MSPNENREKKFREARIKRNKKIELIINLWMCYLLIFSFSHISSGTYSSYSATKTINNKIAVAEDYCADDEWKDKYKEFREEDEGDTDLENDTESDDENNHELNDENQDELCSKDDCNGQSNESEAEENNGNIEEEERNDNVNENDKGKNDGSNQDDLESNEESSHVNPEGHLDMEEEKSSDSTESKKGLTDEL